MKRRLGFTLVEMMAVIAVITILALMAIPSYLDRIVKAQVEAALPLAEIAKGPIAAYWTATQTMPADNAAFVGKSLFMDNLIAVEIVGVLLLIATIGAIVVAKTAPGKEAV